MKQRFDIDKAIQALLFITQRVHNLYHALKVMYFADMSHLEKYGRLICGDQYIAMEHGPVPSGMYDIVKYVRGDGALIIDAPVKNMFRIEGRRTIIPLIDAELDYLSASDIECLDYAILKYGKMGFGDLKKESHKFAGYPVDNENDEIPLDVLVTSFQDKEQILEYLDC